MSSNGLFRTLNRIHIFLYRISRGGILGKIMGSPVLLLTTTGCKTGEQRTVPLVYARDHETYTVIATDNPGWYHNLKKQNQVSIEMRGDAWKIVTARDACEQEQEHLWARLIQQSPAFQKFRHQGSHQLVVLEPVNL